MCFKLGIVLEVNSRVNRNVFLCAFFHMCLYLYCPTQMDKNCICYCFSHPFFNVVYHFKCLLTKMVMFIDIFP